MIQQFQPRYNPPLNIHSEIGKHADNYHQMENTPKTIQAVLQTPFTVVTKISPSNTDRQFDGHYHV